MSLARDAVHVDDGVVSGDIRNLPETLKGNSLKLTLQVSLADLVHL